MTDLWSADQIGALAPDAGSLSAARKLANRWHGTGSHEHALWGRCQGSGAKPYQTIVDLSGPAYKCSCPSRKFPCKHALSLLLNWSEGRVDRAAEIADFAADWLAGRAARAAAPARETTTRSANPATAEQRRVRVTAGLAELDIWLGDQVRTGLAQADRSYRAYEAIAARMVDAQAPGIATALRQLPGAVATRAEWPELVLREYARLHLLVTAHRRLDELSPALRASVRSHIGYPTPAETVRAEPAVRDRWAVLGLRISEEERLYTRRIWLYGRQTRRWAVLVDHSFGSPSFPADVPVPGMQAEAELHYYPGASALRAIWGARHGAAEPFTTLPIDDGTIAAALTAYAEALGADPWVRAWPVLLTEVIPIVRDSGCAVAESDGTALPLAVADPPWRLLAVSGGHPVTLVAEWTREGLVPVSVFTAGEVIELERPEPGAIPPAPSQSSNADLTSTALLGTARRAPDLAGLAAPVAAAAGALRADPAWQLLESAALDDLYARGGRGTETAVAPEPAADDHRRLLPRPAAQRLARLLGDRSAFLPEWFDTAAPYDYRAPDALCAQLLDYARVSSDLREPLLRLAGTRGAWLAAQHPQWQDLRRQPIAAADAEDVWRFGQPPERVAWLAGLRERDPGAARTTLLAAWPKESGPVKAELIAVLAERLSIDDEPLLEMALDDRRSDVRRTAAGLLTLLPESAFAQRMIARAGAVVRGEQRMRHRRLVVTAPETPDAAARRDGIHDRTVEFAYRWAGRPDLAAGWLRQLVAATPLPHWEQLFGAPDKVVHAEIEDRFRQPLVDGWMDAALAHRDSAWARELFELGVPSDLAMLRRRELFALLPVADRTAHLLKLDGSWLSEIEALLPALPHPWPDQVAQHLLLLLHERARAAARRPDAHGTGPSAHRSLLAGAAVHFPLTAARAVTVLARRCEDPNWERAFDQLAHDLNHRSMMLEELQ